MTEERVRRDTESSSAPARPAPGSQRARSLERLNEIRAMLRAKKEPR